MPETTTPRPARPRPPRPRPARTHPRLASDVARSWLAIGIGMPFIVLLPVLAIWLRAIEPEDVVANGATLLSGFFYVIWTIFCLASVLTTWLTFRRATATQLRAWLDATRAPDGRLRRFLWSFNGGGATTWALTGSVVALLALLDLAISDRDVPAFVLWAGVAVVPASIAVIIVSYAVGHARADAARGFVFPGTEEPRFADYLYLSTQITTTFGGSDVEITTTRLRRAVSVHSLIAFGYNAFVVALLVSVLIGVVAR